MHIGIGWEENRVPWGKRGSRGVGRIPWIDSSGTFHVVGMHGGGWRCTGWQSRRLNFMRILKRATWGLMVRQGDIKRCEISIAGVWCTILCNLGYWPGAGNVNALKVVFPRKASIAIFRSSAFHDRRCFVSFNNLIISQEYTNDVIVSVLKKKKKNSQKKHYIISE